MGENSVSVGFICPVCGKEFSTIHEYATHMKWHSEDEKKREAEEEKKRLEGQKKVDAAKLEKLRKAYEVARTEWLEAQEEYEEKYGVKGTNYSMFDLDAWNQFAKYFNNDWSHYL